MTASCSDHPKSLQKELCGAVITFPGWENSFSPCPTSHKVSKSFHYSTTMECHTRQAICFNYGNHFILFSNICRELRATAGQDRMRKPLGRDRERLREAWLVLEVTCQRSLGWRRRRGPRGPRKGTRMQGGKRQVSCSGDTRTSWLTAQKRPHPHPTRHSTAAPCALLCGIQPQRETTIARHLDSPSPQVPEKTGPGKRWVPRTFWALHHLTMSYMELGFKTSWLNVPFIFNFFLNYFFIVTKKIGTVQRKRKERRQEERQGSRQASWVEYP